MISSQDFDRIIYNNPERAIHDERPPLDNIIGLDTEAYTDGVPFMFCTSLSRTHKPEEIPDVFFDQTDYREANFMLYNMKYDAGHIIRHLPESSLHELHERGQTKHPPYRYKYVPHKMLRIYKGKTKVTFWDIAQFYRLSLDNAAKKYLNKQKLDIRTKRFTRKYVKRFWKSISRYCIQDAVLTAQLAEYFINKLLQFGIVPSTIYSSASISFKHFCTHTNIITSWRYWLNSPEVLKFACDAYEGGKFEITKRGYFPHLYEYDLTSAYPYEIANLVDISKASHIQTNQYQQDAVYAYLRVHIDNPKGVHLPCGLMEKNVRIYPAGSYYLTITKEEYDYISPLVKTEIIDGIWLFVKRKRYPYRKVIQSLFSIKDQYKGKDPMLYQVTKVAMNGFYGKTCQCIPFKTKEDITKIQAGAGWNPMYAAVITANTRIKVTKIQNMYKDDCLGTHTDSVFTTRPLPAKMIKSGLGNFEYVTQGEAILVGCGMYQINNISKYKGFNPSHNETWQSILSSKPSVRTLKYKVRRVESWVEAMAKNHGKKTINVFGIAKKEIDLNCDVKRIWPKKLRAKDLLRNQYDSLPRIFIHKKMPNYWTDKKP